MTSPRPDAAAPKLTAREKYQAARREWLYRTRVYPRWVEAGKMTPDKAARELAAMAEIAADYERTAETEEAKGRLI